MVAPIIAALARGAAKSKATAKAAKAKTAARAKKAGDQFYNARRRYQRAAERNLKKAEQTSGATAARYRNLAKQDLNKALSTYDPNSRQQFSKPIQRLADELNVDLEQRRAEIRATDSGRAAETRKALEQSSTSRLAGATESAEELRQAEAKALMNSNIGHRIIGGFVNVWRDASTISGKVDKTRMMREIMDYMGVDNLGDLVQKLEDTLGELLYSGDDSDVFYEVVKLTIQNKIADNTLVA